MKLFVLSFILCPLLFAACAEKALDLTKPVYVTISTTKGDVTVLLYDDTPLHRDNFIRLCRSGAYDGVLFHRVIEDFVVQGGDPESRKREPRVLYGGGDGGYTVPAEIRPQYFNKRGALIDAKNGDDVNPERASAGTQFCFVQGEKMLDEELDQAEVRINKMRANWLFHLFAKRLKTVSPELADSSMRPKLESRVVQLVEDTLRTLGYYKIPEDRREVYRTVGGAPHLDGSVTIFGEVVDGLEIVGRLSRVETDENARPKEDLLIFSTEVFQK